MSEIKKVEIETEETPPQPTLAETQTQMAIAYGQMIETNRQMMSEMQTDKMERSSLATMMSEALAEIRELRSRQDTTTRQTEELRESQKDIILTVADALENEDNKDVIPVTPMETHVQIDQVPLNTKKTFLQKIFFG